MAEILGLELADLGAEALVPQRRLGELARYGMRADASALRRHGDGRRLTTLLATVRHLVRKAVPQFTTPQFPDIPSGSPLALALLTAFVIMAFAKKRREGSSSGNLFNPFGDTPENDDPLDSST